MYKFLIKNLLDYLFALFLLFLLLPIMFLAAILVKISEPQSQIIFKQKRPGKNGKIFTLYKFRTMKEKDDNYKTDFERITKIGKFLRKYSIDELPQLINILKGNMSFIGPRPLLVNYLQYYTPFQMRRHEVKPGITGWAQVNGRNAISWEEKFKLDVWYVDNLSFWLDLKIFFKTIFNVLKRKGINNSEEETMPIFRGTVKFN
mgnify:CR=1 FL=1